MADPLRTISGNFYDTLGKRYGTALDALHASRFDSMGRPIAPSGSMADRAGEAVRRAMQPSMSASQFEALSDQLSEIRNAARRVALEEPADKSSREWMIWNAKLDNLEAQFADTERRIREVASAVTGKVNPEVEFQQGALPESLESTIGGAVNPAPRAPGRSLSQQGDVTSQDSLREAIRARRMARSQQSHPLAQAALATQIEDAVRAGQPQLANGGLEYSQFAFGRPEVQELLGNPNANAALLTLANKYGVTNTDNLAEAVVGAIAQKHVADMAGVNVRTFTADDSSPVGQASASGTPVDAGAPQRSGQSRELYTLEQALASGRRYAEDTNSPLVPYVPMVVHMDQQVVSPAINPVTGRPKRGADGGPIPAVDPRTLPARGTPDYQNMMAGLYRPLGVESRPQVGVFAALEVPDGSGGIVAQPQMDKQLIPLIKSRTGGDGNRSPEAAVWLLPLGDGRYQAIVPDPETGMASSGSVLMQNDIDRLLMAGYETAPSFGFRSPLIEGKDPEAAGRMLFEMSRSNPTPESLRSALSGYDMWSRLGTSDDLRQVTEAAGGQEVIDSLRSRLQSEADPAAPILSKADAVRAAATTGSEPGASQFVIPPSRRRMLPIVASAGANTRSPARRQSTMASDVTSGAAATSAIVEPPTYGGSQLAVTPQGYSLSVTPDGSTAPITVDAGGVIGVGGINPTGGSVVGDVSMAGLSDSPPLPAPDVSVLDALFSTRRPTAVPQMAFNVEPDSWAAGVMGGQAADAQRIIDSLGGPIDVGAGPAGRPFLRQFDPLVGLGIGETAADVSAGVRRARELGINGLTKRLNRLLEMRGEPLQALRDQAETLSKSLDSRTGGLLSQQEQLRVRAQELRDEIEYRKQPAYEGPVWDAGRQEMVWPQDSGQSRLDVDLAEISRLHSELREVASKHRELGDRIRSMKDDSGVTVADDMAMLDGVNARIREIESSPEQYERLTAEIDDLYSQIRSREASRSQRIEARRDARRAGSARTDDAPAAADTAQQWTADVDEADANATRMEIAGAAGQERGQAPVSFGTLRGWFQKAQKARGVDKVRYPVGLSLPDGRAADGRPGASQVGSTADEFARLSAEDAALQEQLDDVQKQLYDARLAARQARRSGDEQAERSAVETLSTLSESEREIQAKLAANEEAVTEISARVAGDSQYESGSAGSNQARLVAKFMGPAPRKGSSSEFVRNDIAASRDAMRELLGTNSATPLAVVDDIVSQAAAEGVKLSRADVVYSMLMRDPAVADSFSRDSVYTAAQKAARELEVEYEPTRPAPTPQNTAVVQKSFVDKVRDFTNKLPFIPKDAAARPAADASPLDELYRNLPNADTVRNLGETQNIFVDLSRMHASDVASGTPGGAFGAMSERRARQTLEKLSGLAGDTSLWPTELAGVKGMLPEKGAIAGMKDEEVRVALANIAASVSGDQAQAAVARMPKSGAERALARIEQVAASTDRFIGPGFGPVSPDTTSNVRAAIDRARREVSAAINPSGAGDAAPSYATDAQREFAEVTRQLEEAVRQDATSEQVTDLLDRRAEIAGRLPADSPEAMALREMDKPTPYSPQPEQFGPTRRDAIPARPARAAQEKVSWNYSSSPNFTVLVDKDAGAQLAESVSKVADMNAFRMRELGGGKVVIEGGKLSPTSDDMAEPEFQTLISVTGDAADLNTRDPQKYAVTLHSDGSRLSPAISEPGLSFRDLRGQGYEETPQTVAPRRTAVPAQPAAEPEYRYDEGMDYENAVEGYGARSARAAAGEGDPAVGLEDPVPGPGRAAANAEYDGSIAARIQAASENEALRASSRPPSPGPEDLTAVRDKGSGDLPPTGRPAAKKPASRRAGETVRALIKRSAVPVIATGVALNLQESGIVPSDEEMLELLSGNQALAGEPGMGSGAPVQAPPAAAADTNTVNAGVIDRVRKARQLHFLTTQKFIP